MNAVPRNRSAKMQLSFRTYGMAAAFISITILLYVQWGVLDMFSPTGFLFSVLGLSAGGVLFVIECLDFWRCVPPVCSRACRHRRRRGSCAGEENVWDACAHAGPRAAPPCFCRICGNRVGCDCCEKLASKTACLIRYQQNYFYRGILYVLGGVGLIAVAILAGGATGTQYVSVDPLRS